MVCKIYEIDENGKKVRELSDVELKRRLLDDVDLFDMATGKEPLPNDIKTAIDNGEITREQARSFTEQDESVIEDIERKAESEDETELNSAIEQADKLIGETVGTTESEKQPTDKGTGESKVTGITKAVQKQEWEALGIDSDFANQLSRDWSGTVLKEANDKIKANPYIADTLAKELNDKPRPTTDTENAILLIEKRRLQNLFDEHYNDTSEDKNPIALLAIQDKLIENMNAIEGAGTALGRGLNSLKMAMAKDYSLATMLAKKRLANDNKPLTPEVEKQITDLHEKITELQKKFDDYVEQKKKESETTDAENGLNRAKRDVRKNNRNLTREKLKAERDVIVSNIKDKVATLLESAVEKTGGKLNAVENKVNNKEVLSSLSLEISNLVKNLVEDKVLDLADIVDNIHDELKGIIPDLSKREVRDAISGYGKEPQKQTKSEIQSEIDRLKKEAKQLSKQEDIESGKIDEPRLKALKTRTANRIKELQEKIAKGDYSKTEKKVYELDDVALSLKAELDREKAKFSKGLQQDVLSKRTLSEKGLDALAQWSRAIKLSGIVTLGKLTAAAAERVAITPAEEAVGGVLSKIFPKLSAKAEREGGINTKIEAQAISKGFMKGMADSWKILTTGESNLDVSYGKQDNLPHSVLDFFGHLHGALKAVPKRIEFERSFAKRMEAQAKKGIDVSNPLVQTKTAIQAYKDSKRAIFMQDNVVASAWSNFIKSLESKNKTTGEDNKVIATIGKTLLPFVKIPTNIVGETLTYAGGSASGSYKLAKALTKGIENVSPEEADVILRHLKKGSLGLGLLALGFFNPQAIGGYYQKYEKRREDEPEAGEVKLFGHKIPKFLVHNPLLECLQIGATARRVSDTYTKGKENTKTSGLMAGLLGIADEVPFVKTGESLKGALESEHEATYFLGSYLKGMIDPALLQDIARFTDKDEKGKVKKRQTDTVLEHIESGLPFLRQSLPEKEQKDRHVTTPKYDEKGKLLEHGRTR